MALRLSRLSRPMVLTFTMASAMAPFRLLPSARLCEKGPGQQASVALNVWQPEIIWGSQRQMIQQSNVPVDFRFYALEMELSLCKQQIAGE
ncbi:UNVERIFIED_CONTAM: F-box protein SKIP24 [Sesamum indicum]